MKSGDWITITNLDHAGTIPVAAPYQERYLGRRALVKSPYSKRHWHHAWRVLLDGDPLQEVIVFEDECQVIDEEQEAVG